MTFKHQLSGISEKYSANIFILAGRLVRFWVEFDDKEGDKPSSDTLNFSFSANMDGDSEDDESDQEHAQEHVHFKLTLSHTQ